MNLEDWGSLKAFESIIPCSTPTWALFGYDGKPDLRRVLAWQIRQQIEELTEGLVVWADMKGLGAIEDGSWIGDLKGEDDFVCYLDESEKGEAQERVDEWLKAKPERDAAIARAREAAKAAREGRQGAKGTEGQVTP